MSAPVSVTFQLLLDDIRGDDTAAITMGIRWNRRSSDSDYGPADGWRRDWSFDTLAFMSGSFRPFVLLLMAVILTASACTAGGQQKPRYFDSDIPGNTAKRAEFPSCAPRTETGPILQDGNLPDYPRREAMSGTIGSVEVQFVITKTGTTTNVETLRATSRRFSTESNNRFAEEVAAAVGQWIFQPAMDQGMPVAVICAQRHIFNGSGVTVILGETRLVTGADQN